MPAWRRLRLIFCIGNEHRIASGSQVVPAIRYESVHRDHLLTSYKFVFLSPFLTPAALARGASAQRPALRANRATRIVLILDEVESGRRMPQSGHILRTDWMSALPPKADIGTQSWNVRFVPIADSCTAAKRPLAGLRFLCVRPHEPAALQALGRPDCV